MPAAEGLVSSSSRSVSTSKDSGDEGAGVVVDCAGGPVLLVVVTVVGVVNVVEPASFAPVVLPAPAPPVTVLIVPIPAPVLVPLV